MKDEIPESLRMAMIFIDRVGFPVLAFILMFVSNFYTLQKMTIALEDNTKALVEFRTATGKDTAVVLENNRGIIETQKSIISSIQRLTDAQYSR